jgi:MFS family permease
VASVPAISSMVLIGSIVVALGELVTSLMPVYVRDVLDTDPAYTIYVVAPAGLGYLAGTITAPWMIKRFGTRRCGVVAFLVTAVGVMLFGFIDQVAPFLAPISPTRLFELFGADLNDKALAAGFIAIPANFGSTATGDAVQNYINARVPLVRQGAVFGMEEAIDNALSIIAILSLGAIATVFGSEVVFVVAPPLILAVVVWLFRSSMRRAGQDAPSHRAVVEELWAGPAGELEDAVTETSPPTVHSDQ